jgi:hypothetical protein
MLLHSILTLHNGTYIHRTLTLLQVMHAKFKYSLVFPP